MPTDAIYWKDIPKGAKVSWNGTWFEADGKMVYFPENERAVAEQRMRSMMGTYPSGARFSKAAQHLLDRIDAAHTKDELLEIKRDASDDYYAGKISEGEYDVVVEEANSKMKVVMGKRSSPEKPEMILPEKLRLTYPEKVPLRLPSPEKSGNPDGGENPKRFYRVYDDMFERDTVFEAETENEIVKKTEEWLRTLDWSDVPEGMEVELRIQEPKPEQKKLDYYPYFLHWKTIARHTYNTTDLKVRKLYPKGESSNPDAKFGRKEGYF